MLNIDYSTPRKFLMSLGLTLILFSFLVFFGTGYFIMDRMDMLSNVASINITVINNLYSQVYSQHLASIVNYFEKLYRALFITGSLSFLLGIILWIKYKK